MNYYLVITESGEEPMAVAAEDAEHILQAWPGVALIAKTTRAMILAAGWGTNAIMTLAELERLYHQTHQRIRTIASDADFDAAFQQLA